MEKSLREIFSKYRWTITGFLVVLILSFLFITVGFWLTLLVLLLCLIGGFFGYLKDNNMKLATFINKFK